jgi:lipoate-protein ligase A
MNEWRLIDSGPCAASYNMALDEAIATEVRKGNAPPTLRFYGWEAPSVSLGSFQKIADLNLAYCISNNIPVVRRPTGGRAILHGDELTYSFSAGNNGFFSGGLLDTYRQLGAALKSGLDMLGVDITMKTERETGKNLSRSPLCFKSTSYSELSYKGKKLIGSAQKRWKDGFLQQGSLPYTMDEESTRTIFNFAPSSDIRDGMIGLREALPDLDPEQFKEAIRISFEKTFRIRFRCSDPSPEEIHLARELEARQYRTSGRSHPKE